MRPTSVRSKPVSSTGRVYKPSSEQTRFLHRCGSSQDLRLCFCSTFEQLANFWLRYSQSNSSFWNASNHWGRDLYNWWWKNGIGYCLLLYYKVQKLWSENTKINIPENEEKWVSSLPIIRKAVSVASLLCLSSERAEKEIKPTIKVSINYPFQCMSYKCLPTCYFKERWLQPSQWARDFVVCHPRCAYRFLNFVKSKA